MGIILEIFKKRLDKRLFGGKLEEGKDKAEMKCLKYINATTFLGRGNVFN